MSIKYNSKYNSRENKAADIKGIIRRESNSKQDSHPFKYLFRYTNKVLLAGFISLSLFCGYNTPNYANKNPSYSINSNFSKMTSGKKNVSNKLIFGLIKSITSEFDKNDKGGKENKLPIGISAYGLELQNGFAVPYKIETKEVIGIAKINSISAKSGKSNNDASLQLNVTLRINSNKITYYWLQNVAYFNTKNKTLSMNDNIFASNKFGNVQMHRDGLALGKGKIYNELDPFEINNFYLFLGKRFDYSLPIKNLVMAIEAKKEEQGVLIDFAYAYKDGKYIKPIAKVFDRVLIKTKDLKSFSIIISPKIVSGSIKDGDNILNAEFVWGGAINGENATFSSMSSMLDMLYRKNGNFLQFPFVFDFGYSTAETTSNLKDNFNKNGTAVITNGKMDISHANN